MNTSIRPGDDRYFGIEIAPDGKLVVAERMQGRPVPSIEFPPGNAGAQALRQHIERECAHPHVCIKACGAAALALAAALLPAPGVELTIVSRQTIRGPASDNVEQRAAELARLAERLF